MKIYFNQKVMYRPWGGGVHFLTNYVEFLKEEGHDIV
ncbi:hypothetical protein LCGC14_3115130, partial [marine sediment metagenome]